MAPRRAPLFVYPELPEIRLCFLLTFGSLFYAWYQVFKISNSFKFSVGDRASVHQLPFVGERFKDETNWEWGRWSPFALSYVPALLIHSLLFNVGQELLSESAFVPLYTIASIATASYYFSPWLAFYSILQGTLIFLASNYFKFIPLFSSQLSRRTWVVWMSSLPILHVSMHHTELLTNDPFLVLLFVAYTLVSYISFNLETLHGPVRKEDDTLWKRYQRMLFYTFYQPYMVSLIVLYPDFERQIANRPNKKREWPKIILSFVRLAGWWVVMEVGLHFFYYEAILRRIQFANSLPKHIFVSLGMALGITFQVKYVIIFGLPSAFAALDKMEPLPGPICIARVTLYSRVWREFDRGLYNFFKQYLFVPICAPTFSIPRQIIGVFVSYGFVLLWHGVYHHNIVWIGLNIIALLMEKGSMAVYSLPAVKGWREAHISDTNFRRILAWLQIIPFAVGLYSNFYFLGGSLVGGAFYQRILIEETITLRYPFFLLITVGYFYTQVTMEIERFYSLREAKKGKKSD